MDIKASAIPIRQKSGESCKKKPIQPKILSDRWDSRYNLYYSLTYSINKKNLGLKLKQTHITLYFIFYQINKNYKIQTCNRLVIKTLISY
jgi:hypothetical protein